MTPIKRLQSNKRMSQAVVYNGIVYLAGQTGNAADNIHDQVVSALNKIEELLETTGSSKASILQATIWLSDMRHFATMNEIWEKWIDPDNPPARATGQSSLANPDYKVEILVTAAVDAS